VTFLSLLPEFSANVVKKSIRQKSHKDLFDVSSVLWQNAFETTSLFTDASFLQDMLLVHIKSPTITIFAAVFLADYVRLLSSHLSIMLQSILFSNLSIQVLLQILSCNSCRSCQKRNPACWLLPGSTTLCYKFA